MGLTEIRTAMKVDLKKPASEQPGLHVPPPEPLFALNFANSAPEQVASRRSVSTLGR